MHIDFLVHNFGTVCTIEARSEHAKEFADENFVVEGWQGVPTHFTTDWRPAQNLCERLTADGFNVVEA